MHIPVLLNEVLTSLEIKQCSTYLDCTFGLGGYSKAILSNGGDVIAIDRDPEVIPFANELEKEFGNRFKFLSSKFSNIGNLAIDKVNGAVFDFGISSFQLDNSHRGFSFQTNGPLDMRMSNDGISAHDVVNNMSESDIADIIYFYGEEFKARQIAKLIVSNRPINTTKELADIISNNVKKCSKIHPATLTFQAIRVFVNDELKEIDEGLKNVLEITTEKILCVTFQGLENRVIKDFARNNKLKLIATHSPTRQELIKNPRSRSARLKVYCV